MSSVHRQCMFRRIRQGPWKQLQDTVQRLVPPGRSPAGRPGGQAPQNQTLAGQLSPSYLQTANLPRRRRKTSQDICLGPGGLGLLPGRD